MLKIHDLPWAGRGMGPGQIGDPDGSGADNDDATEPSTILFWDDFYLNRYENLTREIGQPQLVPEATIEEPGFWLGSGYPTVFRDEESGVWRCEYNGKSTVPGEQPDSYALVAESPDGIHWEFPDLSAQVPLPYRKYPHQVLVNHQDVPEDADDPSLKVHFHQWDCFYDHQAENPEERVKGFVAGTESPLYTSPDGLRWKRMEGAEWRTEHPDPPSTAFWNHVRGTYVMNARPTPDAHPRRIAFTETTDWRTYTEPELIIGADALDTPLAEIYGMIAFPYASRFVGLVWIFHCEPPSMFKYWGGPTDCQLAYSYNGWHFHRSLRTPFIPNTEPGELGAGTMRPHSLVVDEDLQIRIYSSSARVEHGYHINAYRHTDYPSDRLENDPGDGYDQGAILMHKLRLDGFYYLKSSSGRGLLGTRGLLWHGGEAYLNVQSGHQVHVQVTDVEGAPIEGYRFEDCEPFRGDALGWSPRWTGGRGLNEFTGQAIRLEVQLNNARIYAIRGLFTAMANRETRTFVQTGEVPKRRLGFG